ncbi:MAG: peptidase MA family metallohydrolase [Myxococcota bacterium]
MTRSLFFLFLLGGFAHAGVPQEALRVEAPQIPSPLPAIASGEISTEHFRLVHTPNAKGAARALSEDIEQFRRSFEHVLGRTWPGLTEVRVGLGREEFEALALPGGKPPSWAIALAYPSHNVMLVEARSLTGANGSATVVHELAHVALGQLGDGWPRWFHEGLASYLADARRFSLSQYATMFRAVQQERIFAFEDLADGWPTHPDEVEVAYAQSEAFVAFLLERHSRDSLGRLFDAVQAKMPFETAFGMAFSTSLALEERAWQKTLPARYSWVPIVTGGTTLWALAAGLCAVGYIRVRAARARKRALLEAEEAAQAEQSFQDVHPS